MSMVQAFYGRDAGPPPAGVGEQKIGATWIGGGPYTGLNTAADPSLACAQPTRPCDRHGARHFTRASLGRACSSPGEGEGELHMDHEPRRERWMGGDIFHDLTTDIDAPAVADTVEILLAGH